MDRSKRFLFNSACTAIMQVSAILCGFIVNRVILATYSAETSGFVMSIIQYSSYFIVMVAGVSGAAAFALYAPLADNDYKKANGILTKARQVFFHIGLIALLINAVIIFVYPIFVTADMAPLYIRAVIFAMSILIFFEMVVIPPLNTLVNADQRTYSYSLVATASFTIQLLIVYIVSKTGVSAVFVCLSYLAAVMFRSIIMFLYIKRNYPDINYKGTPISDWMQLQKYVLYVQVIGLLQTVLPIFFTTLYTDLETVRIYATYNLIIMGMVSLLSVFATNIFPALGNVVARDEKQVLTSAYHKFEILFFAFTALLSTAAVLAITEVIRLYTIGIENAGFENIETGMLFILNIVFFAFQYPMYGLLQAEGMYKEMKNPATIHLAIFIVLTMILAPRFGLEGILIASICGNIYRSIRLVFYLPKIIEGYKMVKSFVRQGVAVFIVVLSYFVYKMTASYIDGFISLVIYTFVMTFFIGLLLAALIFITDRREFLDTIREIKRILISKKTS